jgi:hypothetical protein
MEETLEGGRGPPRAVAPLERERMVKITKPVDQQYYCFYYNQRMRIYRVSQEERTIFWEVIVSVILGKKLYMNMCPIPNGFQDRAILVVWLGRPVLSFPPALLWEGRSIFWEVIVSVILNKKLYKNVSYSERFPR